MILPEAHKQRVLFQALMQANKDAPLVGGLDVVWKLHLEPDSAFLIYRLIAGDSIEEAALALDKAKVEEKR